MKMLRKFQFIGALIEAHEKRVAIKQLNALPDYLLADIGIERDAIPGAVTGLMRRSATAPANTVTARRPLATAQDLLLNT